MTTQTDWELALAEAKQASDPPKREKIKPTPPQPKTTRQSARRLLDDTRRTLEAMAARDRQEITESYQQFVTTLEQNHKDIEAALQDATTSALRRAVAKDRIAILMPRDIEQVLSGGDLRRLRAEAMRGEAPTMIIAARPKVGDRTPRGPVLAIIDLTALVGWPEG